MRILFQLIAIALVGYLSAHEDAKLAASSTVVILLLKLIIL
jgi:hypothetical protein